VAGQLLLEAERIEKGLKGAPDAAALLRSYTEAEHPWCMLDTHHRHLERRTHRFDFDPGGGHRRLEQLLARARDRYTEVGAKLAEGFLRAYEAARFRIPGILRQREIFAKRVKPFLGSQKTAYVWVDALRFEMGRELAHELAEEFDVTTESALATVPTITESGMASLLPLPEEPPAMVAAGAGKLALRIDGTVIKDRPKRIDFLREHAAASLSDVKLEDLPGKPKQAAAKAIKEALFVLVTFQEIDALCEADNIHQARLTMDDILHELRRAFHSLSELGIERIVVAADHGYLFGEEAGSEMTIDPPGGVTANLHRRVWIGNGGATDPACLRAKLADFGLDCEWDLVTPWNFARFKTQGARAYFHGGLSPQELVVPVLTLERKQATPRHQPQIDWALTLGSPKITTRFLSVTVGGRVTGLFDLAPPRVRVEVRGAGGSLSTLVSASYGLQEGTGDVTLRPEQQDPKSIDPLAVALMINGEPADAAVSVCLLDAETGAELARLSDVPLEISL
jgi:hypothetical protein